MDYKSVGLLPESYAMLLSVKHALERDAGGSVSFDKVIKTLVEKFNGGVDD